MTFEEAPAFANGLEGVMLSTHHGAPPGRR